MLFYLYIKLKADLSFLLRNYTTMAILNIFNFQKHLKTFNLIINNLILYYFSIICVYGESYTWIYYSLLY
jgi:hypothetical protein